MKTLFKTTVIALITMLSTRTFGQTTKKILNNKVKDSVEVKEEYYPSKKIKSQLKYINGSLNGESIYYFENGHIDSSIPYLNGNKHGVIKHFNEKGILTGLSVYDNGLMTLLKVFDEKGELHTETVCIKDVPIHIFHYEKGKITADGATK